MRLPGLGDDAPAARRSEKLGQPRRSGIGVHHATTPATDDWLTPRAILDELGPFDLDPCDTVDGYTGAARWYSYADDGLDQPWTGRVWLNPPYSDVGRWVARLACHGDGILLTFARTETSWFHRWVWGHASALLFLAGRLTFSRADGAPARGNAGGPSVLAAYGLENARQLGRCDLAGAFVPRVDL